MFAPLERVATGLGHCANWPSLSDLERLAARHPASSGGGASLRFVPQGPKSVCFEDRYEPRIYLRGEVQTRPGHWHDLLNALVWLAFPRAKAALNRRHYEDLSAAEAEGRSLTARSPARDFLTLFDESGVIVVSESPMLTDLLLSFRWKELFWTNRNELRRRMGFLLFGHGLYEKALNPFLGMTGKALILPVPDGFLEQPRLDLLAAADLRIAAVIGDPGCTRSGRDLAPLPVLGVPGWSAGNGRPEYYDNADYFRPGRRSSAAC